MLGQAVDAGGWRGSGYPLQATPLRALVRGPCLARLETPEPAGAWTESPSSPRAGCPAPGERWEPRHRAPALPTGGEEQRRAGDVALAAERGRSERRVGTADLPGIPSTLVGLVDRSLPAARVKRESMSSRARRSRGVTGAGFPG